MEQFELLRGEQTLASSREQINNALLSVRSLHSGTAFPVNNISDGMLCYRTDEGKIYQYQERAQAWVEKVLMDISGSADKLATARKICGVAFDGTKDIELPTAIEAEIEALFTE